MYKSFTVTIMFPSYILYQYSKIFKDPHIYRICLLSMGGYIGKIFRSQIQEMRFAYTGGTLVGGPGSAVREGNGKNLH
jgi:hypothetical protein